MRTLMKVTLDVEASSRAIKDGTLPKLIMDFTERAKPEASYFTSYQGKRTAFFVFDLKSTSDLPVLTEPIFSVLKAEIDISPVMNAEELQKGLKALDFSVLAEI